MKPVKQAIDISFAQGLDTKTDPKRVQIGNFLSLENSIFQKGGLLQKRNGYAKISSLPGFYSYLTTYNGNLTAIGENIAAYNETNETWVEKGSIAPMSINTLPLLRNNLNQIACDSVVAPNGLMLTAYLESNGTTVTNKYVIADSITGQNIVAPTAIPVGSGTVSGGMRVFILNSFFLIVFTNTISATTHLQYVAISINNPTSVSSNTDLAAVYAPLKTELSWDGVVAGTSFYFAYNSTTGGQSVKASSLNSSFIVATPISFSGYTAQVMSVCADTTGSTPYIYLNFYDNGSSNGYGIVLDQNLGTVLAPTNTFAGFTTVLNITAAAQDNLCYLFCETGATYNYNSVATNDIHSATLSLSGIVVGPNIAVRSVGLASKAFIVNEVVYVLSAYNSTYQSTYFLINGSTSLAASPVVVAKLAYENGGGYLTNGLPSVTVINNVAQVPYLYKDLIQAVNKNTNVPSGTQIAGIYAQTGINLATFAIGAQNLDTSEIGQDLHISGGFLWMYDGYLPVEHNFFLWPDNVVLSLDSNPTPTGTITNNSNMITSLSSTANIGIGDTISGTSIPSGTTVIAVGSGTVTMSANATASATETITFTGNLSTSETYYYQVTYEWSDNNGNIFRSAPSIPVSIAPTSGNTKVVLNIPNLRLTYKTANPVKICIYRWSTSQQNYYEVTSVIAPLLNSTQTNSSVYIDGASDSSILGNALIYTTGGVVEDVNAPATNLMTLFDTRLWLVDAEDQNLLWFSKQVIEATPVEMSDLFTMYIAPTTGSQGSTGPITALSVMDDKLIIFKQNAIYYINGVGPDNTGANNQYSEPVFVTSTVGCANQQSIVFMPQGLMFQSDKGIWLLDRSLNTSYIGAAVEQYNAGTVQSAQNIPETNQVRFILSTGITLMYDYFYSQWGTFTGVPAISSCIYKNLHTFIDIYSRAFQESPGIYLDGSNPVLMQFTTGPIRLGQLQNYQRAYTMFLMGSYISPHKLQVGIAYDYEPSVSQTDLLVPNNYSTAYGTGQSQNPYGQGNPYGGQNTNEHYRIFLQRQRCMAVSLSVQEIYDSSLGVAAGAGFTLSGLNIVCGFKSQWSTLPSTKSYG